MPYCTFSDDRGRHVPAVDASEMKEVDRVAISDTGPNLFQMMENAGRNLAELVIETFPSDWAERHIVVLAGTGGNGGGGVTAGRHLTNHGGRVTVVVTDEARMGNVAKQQLAIYRAAGGAVALKPPSEPGLVIDAVIGYSLSGAPRGRALELIAYTYAHATPVLSLDVPSGLNATTEETPGSVVQANATMTLALPKIGLCSSLAGDIVLADIGIPALTYRKIGRPAAAAVFDGRYRVPLQR
ncbi:MAG: NAD(P)H-hydrate epimerase, partial [Acidimicrobiia bacterium]|nr:NAD(P)H-hydrate epimerase [Acidimicrobiia bacterium]